MHSSILNKSKLLQSFAGALQHHRWRSSRNHASLRRLWPLKRCRLYHLPEEGRWCQGFRSVQQPAHRWQLVQPLLSPFPRVALFGMGSFMLCDHPLAAEPLACCLCPTCTQTPDGDNILRYVSVCVCTDTLSCATRPTCRAASADSALHIYQD